jgi:glycosidase
MGWSALSRRRFIASGICCTALGKLGGAAEKSGAAVAAGAIEDATPGWITDLVIYEIATKGFTSPSGAATGNFNSLRAKLPYLHELGVTGIWLTGHNLCDARHFYNIWTQYAVIDPERLDPTLGSEAEFKQMVDEAHRNGIRIFLDTVTHGLMESSPVVRQHPEWFRGSSWGMADFDWVGGHLDLDDWWVQLHTGFVKLYGIDGFRLDVDIYRPDLWARIRLNAAALGHPVAIFEEVNSAIEGVTDFTQKGFLIPSASELDLRQGFEAHVDFGNDIAGVYARRFGETGDYRVEVQYGDDGSSVTGRVGEPGKLSVRLVGLREDVVPRRFMERVPMQDGIPDVELVVENVEKRPIENISVRDEMGQTWALHPYGETRQVGLTEENAPTGAGTLTLHLHVATLAAGYSSALLSCHDNGWEGFPKDANPFSAQGSRARFGYSCLFTPAIPIFFSGEEFDATFRPLPGLSPYLYSGAESGKGRWLYGAQLDWEEIDREPHRSMLEDVRSMIALRSKEKDVLTVSLDRARPNLCAVSYECDSAIPVPYMRWASGRAILVAANRSESEGVRVILNLPLKTAGMEGHDHYRVTRLWPSGDSIVKTAAELEAFACVIRKDKTPGGGLAVFSIEPA